MKRKTLAYLAALFISAGANAAFAIIMAFVNKELLNTVTNGELVYLHRIVYPAVAAFVLICLIFPLFIYLKVIIIRSTINELKENTYKHITMLPMKTLNFYTAGDIISRITNDIDIIREAIDNQMQVAVYSLFAGIGSIVSMLILDWRLFIFCFILGLFSTWINARYANVFRELHNRIRVQVTELTQKLYDFKLGIRTIKLFGLYRLKQSEYLLQADLLKSTQKKVAEKTAQLDSINYFLESANTLGLFIVGVIMIWAGFLNFGVVAGVMTLQGGLNYMLQTFGKTYTQLQGSIAGAERVCQILSLPIEAERLEVPCDKEALGEGIDVINLTFLYEERSKIVLNDVSFSVPFGKTVALVGPSGEGKSTIAKLLLGLYNYEKGAIFIGGRGINTYSLMELREKISYVSQNPMLFSGSIFENIALGRQSATKEEIIAAAKFANAHTFIMGFPNQYDTDVGELGNALSGGQRQRICIARAILKDSPIFIFDEATSSLDRENELMVTETISKLRKNKTCIIIAHRLQTIKEVDMIIYVSEGRIAEMGTHNELMKREGCYEALYKSQYS